MIQEAQVRLKIYFSSVFCFLICLHHIIATCNRRNWAIAEFELLITSVIVKESDNKSGANFTDH